jgi:ankyrin repeat protein
MKETTVKITIKTLALVLFMGNLLSMEEPSAKRTKKEEQEILQQDTEEIPLLTLAQSSSAMPGDEKNQFKLEELARLVPAEMYTHKGEIVNALFMDETLSDQNRAKDQLKIIMKFCMSPTLSKECKLEFIALCKAYMQEKKEEYQQNTNVNAYICPLIQFFEYCLCEKQGARSGHTTYVGGLEPSNIEDFSVKYTFASIVKKLDLSEERGIRLLLHLLDDRLSIISPESARTPKEVIECFGLLGDDFYAELCKVIGESYYPSIEFFDFLDKQQKLQSFIVLEGKQGRTFLNQALEYSRKDLAQVIVKAILQEYGSCYNLPAELKDIAAHIAIIAGDTKAANELITKENIEMYPDDNDHATPLWIAVLFNNVEMVKHLLDKGASVNLCNNHDDGETLLHLAVALDHGECVKMLLEHGADSKECDDDEDTPFDFASDTMQKLLLAHAVQKYLGTDDEEEREDIAHSVSGAKHTTNNTLIHGAARLGCTDILEAVLKQGNSDVNAQNRNRWLPSENKDEGYTALHEAIENGHNECIRILLEHNADPNIQTNEKRMAPLHQAALRGNHECVRILLKYGADANLQNSEGKTPLAMAVLAHDIASVQILLEHKADPTIKDKEGNSPLSIASDDAIKELLLKSARSLYLLKNGFSLLAIERYNKVTMDK